MNILGFKIPWTQQPAVVKQPLSFVAWLKQQGAEIGVHERSELTFVTDGVAFDVKPPTPPALRSDVSVGFPHTDERKAQVRKIMVSYSLYLESEFGITDTGLYVHWADCPVVEMHAA